MKVEIIRATDLAVGYENRIVAENISFCLNSGDYLCIIGENGSGKSTLMKTLLSLQDPIEGQIVFGDEIKRNELGYLPQQTEIQKDFPASVREVVFSGCQAGCGWRPFYSSKEKKTAEHNMERMGIEALADRCYRELSGGQQQRVLLARALCSGTKVLFLDEPVNGLDPAASREMYDVIRSLNSEGLTILMVSHDVQVSLNDASHVLYIGKENFFGTREQYYEWDNDRPHPVKGGDAK